MPQRWLNRGLVRNSSPGVLLHSNNVREWRKNNFFRFSINRCLSTFQLLLWRKLFVFITPCDLVSLLVLWTIYYSKYYPVSNRYAVIKVLISDRYYIGVIVLLLTLRDSINFISHEGTFYLTVNSYETPLKRRLKIEPRFLAHLTSTVSEILDLSFLPEL